MKNTKKLNKKFISIISDYKNIKLDRLYSEDDIDYSSRDYEINCDYRVEAIVTLQLHRYNEFDGKYIKPIHFEIHDIIEVCSESYSLILDELDKLEIIDLLEKAIKYKLDIDIDSTPITQISIEEKICDLYHRKKEESFY